MFSRHHSVSASSMFRGSAYGANRMGGLVKRLACIVAPIAALALVGTAKADLINDGGFETEIKNQWSWRAGKDATGQWYAKNYSISDSGHAQLDKASNHWQRRTVMQGLDMDEVGAGTFTLSLDTAISDYWKQLNYWKVLGVKHGDSLSLHKSGFIWNREMGQSETLFKDYAPDGADDGAFNTFTGEFTITDEMVEEFDYLVIGLVGSRRSGDVLLWDNVSLRASGAGGDVPEPASLAMMLMGAGFFGCHARKRRARKMAEQNTAAALI
ncbi:MAG: PEP-CTERM sorting domain-containing protein [Planctomycetota bacterium]